MLASVCAQARRDVDATGGRDDDDDDAVDDCDVVKDVEGGMVLVLLSCRVVSVFFLHPFFCLSWSASLCA